MDWMGEETHTGHREWALATRWDGLASFIRKRKDELSEETSQNFLERQQ